MSENAQFPKLRVLVSDFLFLLRDTVTYVTSGTYKVQISAEAVALVLKTIHHRCFMSNSYCLDVVPSDCWLLQQL